jgi:putative RecB family exonuclease
MPDHLSVSQINLYLLCSLKYRFQYLDELPKPFRSSALVFGSAIHAALAWYHNQEVIGNGVTLEKLCKIFEADWYAQGLETEILYDSVESKAGLRVTGREILGLYFAQPQQKIQGSEVAFTIPLVNPATGEKLPMNLEGFIDLIAGDDEIIEFKTSGQAMNTRDADNHLQLTAYSYAYQAINHRPAKLLRIVDLVKARKPKMVVLDTSRTVEDHTRFFHLAKAMLSGVRNRVFFPRTGFWCRDCEYAEQCKAWEGN